MAVARFARVPGAAVLVLLAGAFVSHPALFPLAQGEDPVPAKPVEIVVAADGSGTHKTIAGGLAAAAAGATVTVKPGTYQESVELRKAVTLVAAKGGRVLLKAPEGMHAMTVSADATVEGFLLQGTDEGDQAAVRVEGGKSVLRGCEISAPNGCGVVVRGASLLLDAVTVRDCRDAGIHGGDKAKLEVSGGTVRRSGRKGLRLGEESELSGSKWEVTENDGGGLYLQGKSKAVLTDCRFLDGKASGILVEEDSVFEGTNLEVARNTTSGVEVRLLGRVLLKGCNVRGNKESGVWAHHKGQVILQKCLVEGNASTGLAAEDGETIADAHECRFVDGKDGGIYLINGAKVLAEKCEFTGNSGSGVEVDAGGEATIHDCRMTKNTQFGVVAKEGALGKVDKCDLRGNLRGTVYRHDRSKIEFKGNREK